MTAPTTHEAPTSARMNGVLFLLSLSVLINYIDRSNLSIAAPLIKDELHISASQLGTLLSAFFWTYAFMQIPAGWLVDRFDVKWVFAAGFFLWSAATAVTGVLHGFAALLIIRVILGVGESIAFPSYSKIIGTYFDKSRRGSANSLIIAGLALGPALGMLVGGTAVGRFGWRPFFLALGLVGLLWLATVVGLDAAPQASGRRVCSRRTGIYSRLRPALGLGNLSGAGSDQLLSLFPGDLAAVLSGAQPPSFHELDGATWRPRLSHVGHRQPPCGANFRITGSRPDPRQLSSARVRWRWAVEASASLWL